MRVHKPVINLEVSRMAILQNLKALKKLAPAWEIAPVLKSNAYGHGLVMVAEILKNENVAFLCIDSYPEAEILRRAGIKTPLLIMGHSPVGTMLNNRLKNISFVVSSLRQLKELDEAAKLRFAVQLKFDTGMHRQGILPEEIEEVLEILKKNPKLKVEGVMSHFAESEKPDSILTKNQIKKWNALALRFQKEFPVKFYHVANSGAFGFSDKINANVGRSGIAIYGINPGNLPAKLKPALSVKTIISEVREIEIGESVGYNGDFIAKRKSKIATIPFGYFEGLNRKLSGKGFVKIGKRFVPIAGKISMNISSYDVTELDVKVAENICVISNQPENPNSIENIAKLCETNPYEILVNIPAHLRRNLT